MSHWNHRLVRREYPVVRSSGEIEVQYEIHEAHYGLPESPDDDTPAPLPAITVDPIDVSADSPAGARWVLEAMLRALDKPILDYETREELTLQQCEDRDRALGIEWAGVAPLSPTGLDTEPRS